MARIRTIKPELWTHGAFMECSLNARLLFIGTWNFADDFGNLDRSAKQLKARIFPGDSLDCEPLIQELIAHGRLIEYSVNGQNYLHIHKFLEHQVINRPGKPQCPSYEHSVNVHGILREDSGLKGREGKGSKPSRASNHVLNGAFLEFWQIYPRKKSKGAAEKAWLRIKPDERLTERILAAVKRATTSADWAKDGGQFIPHPATWLNAKGWEDELFQRASQPLKVAL